MIGRVVNPLGQPLDGGPADPSPRRRKMDIVAPGIAERQPVNEPLQTGIKAIDAMTPIGRGQRELIIGDRKTGKTAIAIDTIINQKGKGVICFYVAIGSEGIDRRRHRRSAAGRRRDGLHDRRRRQRRRPRPAAVHRPLRRLRDGRVLHVEGRGTRCASTTTCPSRPPPIASSRCCCAARRAAKRIPATCSISTAACSNAPSNSRDDKGGGSLTALPIIETQEGEVSAYIPTNVISITDGQIYLEPDLFFAGVRPAINVGISVSPRRRQRPDQGDEEDRRLAAARPGRLPRAGSVRPARHRARQGHPAQLDRGSRLVELLKQPQYKPMPVEQEVMVIYAGTKGYLDDVPVNRVQEFQNAVPAVRRRQRRRTPQGPGRQEGADRRDRRPAQAGADRLQGEGWKK